MNYFLNHLPERDTKTLKKKRNKGLTMVMDKGLSLRQVEDLIETSSEYIDIVKLGWATSYCMTNLAEKINLFDSINIGVYLGGTLFEIFIARDQFDDYRRLLDKYQLKYAEVSDGSITLNHDKKCEYIHTLKEQVIVLSEVGSKDDTVIIPPYKWIEYINKELEAGSWKVIGEARESGNVGLFRRTGEVRSGLVDEILTKVPGEKILWEAPRKPQQVWFIKLLGANVNLGNIAHNDVIPLETLRLGLRGDTFHTFLPVNKL